MLKELRQATGRLIDEEVRVEALGELEELKRRLKETEGGSFLFFFVGPNALGELKRFDEHVSSLDELVMHVAGTYTNEQIIVLTTSRDDENVLIEFKAVYEMTPRQLAVLRAEKGDFKSLIDEMKRFLVLGYNKALLCSPDLALSFGDLEGLFLEVVGVKKGFSFINALDVLRTSVLTSSATNETIQWPCDHRDILLIIEPEDASSAVYDADPTTHIKFWVDVGCQLISPRGMPH